MQANHETVLAAVLQNQEPLEYASEDFQNNDRPIQLFAEKHLEEIRVRCVGLSGVETVVHFELDADAEVLAPRVKEALPPALGRITLALPGGTIIQPPGMGPLDLKLPDGTYSEGITFPPFSVHELFGQIELPEKYVHAL